jgi:hypothetical protein
MAALWAWKQANLSLYAVPVFENHPRIVSLPKLADTCVSEHGLEWKRAFCARFHENERFKAQNWVYKFGHCAEFIYRSFLAWKQAEYDGFWKRSFSQRDKRGSETLVIFGSFSACIRPHQTNTIILEEKMKTTLPECFRWKRAYIPSNLLLSIEKMWYSTVLNIMKIL